MEILENLKSEQDETLAVKNPQVFATELMAGKNLWLGFNTGAGYFRKYHLYLCLEKEFEISIGKT